MSKPPIDVIHSPVGQRRGCAPRAIASTSAIDAAFSSARVVAGAQPEQHDVVVVVDDARHDGAALQVDHAACSASCRGGSCRPRRNGRRRSVRTRRRCCARPSCGSCRSSRARRGQGGAVGALRERCRERQQRKNRERRTDQRVCETHRIVLPVDGSCWIVRRGRSAARRAYRLSSGMGLSIWKFDRRWCSPCTKPRDRPDLEDVDRPSAVSAASSMWTATHSADHDVMSDECVRPGSVHDLCSRHSKWTGEPSTRGGRTSRDGAARAPRPANSSTPRSTISAVWFIASFCAQVAML